MDSIPLPVFHNTTNTCDWVTVQSNQSIYACLIPNLPDLYSLGSPFNGLNVQFRIWLYIWLLCFCFTLVLYFYLIHTRKFFLLRVFKLPFEGRISINSPTFLCFFLFGLPLISIILHWKCRVSHCEWLTWAKTFRYYNDTLNDALHSKMYLIKFIVLNQFLRVTFQQWSSPFS